MVTKGERRETKRNKKRQGMQVSGRSVFVLAEQPGTTKKNRKNRRRK